MGNSPSIPKAQSGGSRSRKSQTGWRRVKFGDVVRLVKQDADPNSGEFKRYVAGEHIETDNLHIRTWGTIGDGYLGPAFHRKFVRGQVLYGSRRTYLRKIAVAEFDGITANTTFVLEPNGDDLLPELLPFVMQTEAFTQHSIKQSKGSVNPYINWKDLAWFEFMLPSKEEQRRIAEILWAANTQEVAFEKLTMNAKQVEEALISESFETSAGNQKLALSALADVVYGLTVDGKRRRIATEFPYLRVANVARGSLNLQEIKSIGCGPDELARFQLRRDDVLVVEGHADVCEIGRAAIWADEIPICLHQNHILRARCGDALNPQYLLALMNSQKGRYYFKSRAKSTSGLHTINSTVVREFPVPSVLREQQDRFVSSLDAIRERVMRAGVHVLACKALAVRLRKALIENV